MALSDILSKIDAETAKKLKELQKDFDAKSKELKKQFDAEKKKVQEDFNADTASRLNKVKENAETAAAREADNALLNAKRECINDIIDEAVAKLASSKEYETIITTMLKKVHLDSAEVIPAKGKKAVTENAVKASGKDFTVSAQEGDFEGGFVVKSEKVEVNNSFATIIGEVLREEIEMELNKLLFND